MIFNPGEQTKIQKTKHDKTFNTETMLSISEIKNDIIILNDGGLRSIMKISGLNLDLKNYDEQEIILEQYKRFLNSLNFPVQILVRNTYLDLSSYLGVIKRNVADLDNKALINQGNAYLKFLEDIDSNQGLIFVKEFYIIVPFYEGEQDNGQINKARWSKLIDALNAKDSVEKIVARYRVFLKGKKQIDTRCNLISEGLGGMGIVSEKITTSQIISLLFRCYNPIIHGSQSEVNVESII